MKNSKWVDWDVLPYKYDYKEIDINVSKHLIKVGDRKDHMTNPLRKAIKRQINGDVVILEKTIIFYSKKFNKNNLDILLGRWTVGAILIEPELSDILRKWESKGVFSTGDYKIKIPTKLLKQQ